jgi:hypothetical protein
MDLLETLKKLSETISGDNSNPKRDSLSTKVVWKIVEKEDTILLLLPNIQSYFTIHHECILQEFRETITELMQIKPKYIVAYICNLEEYTKEMIHEYEKIYSVEFQWLSSFDLLQKEEYMEYHHPSKVYLFKGDIKSLYHTSKLFTKVILDVLDYPKEVIDIIQEEGIPIHYGKCFLEEIINVKIYLNKLMTSVRFRPGTREESNDFDMSLILGKITASIPSIEYLIYNSLKRNQCSLLFSCNPEVSKNIPSYKKDTRSRIPMVDYQHEILDIDVIHELIGRIQRLSTNHNTHVFIGSFSFENKEARELWEKNIELFEGVSIFDPFAYDCLIGDFQITSIKNKYRLTKEPLQMLDMFFTGITDPIHHQSPLKEEYTEEDEYNYHEEEEDPIEEDGNDENDDECC